jgi:hypothetical protein
MVELKSKELITFLRVPMWRGASLKLFKNEDLSSIDMEEGLKIIWKENLVSIDIEASSMIF